MERKQALASAFPDLPLAFVAVPPRDGDGEGSFLLRQHQRSAVIQKGRVVLVRPSVQAGDPAAEPTSVTPDGAGGAREAAPAASSGQPMEQVVVSFVDASPEARLEGRDQLPGVAHSYRGSDPAAWVEGAKTYGAVAQADLYPGITHLSLTAEGRMKTEFHVAPGADPAQIRMSYSGAERVEIDERGDLVLSTRSGEWRESAPVAFQTIGSKRVPVSASFKILSENQVGFDVGAYDAEYELVIDPVIYARYIGGNSVDVGFSLAVDEEGFVYVCGTTTSTDFPAVNQVPGVPPGDQDLFLTKLSPNGSTLIYSTLFGGSAREIGASLVIDEDGNAYCSGWTLSADMPTTMGVFQPAHMGGGDDAAIFKLDPSGNLLAATYLGSTGDDQPEDLAIDGNGDLYILGNTSSPAFPTTVGPPSAGIWDIFVTKMSNTLTGPLVYSRYIGGSAFDDPRSIAVDRQNEAYIVGRTESSDYPIVIDPAATQVYDAVYDGTNTVFLSKLDATGANLVYSTFLDGVSSTSIWIAVDVDRFFQAHVALTYEGSGFPSTPSTVFDPTPNGLLDGVVMKVKADGSGLIYSTYLGGSGDDRPTAILVDRAGRAHVTGGTTSADFPLLDPFMGPQGMEDVFLSEIETDGSGLRFSTYFGGSSDELADDLAFGPCITCLSGRTSSSTDFPINTGGAYGGGPTDAFATCWHVPLFEDGFESGDTSMWSATVQ